MISCSHGKASGVAVLERLAILLITPLKAEALETLGLTGQRIAAPTHRPKEQKIYHPSGGVKGHEEARLYP